MAPPAETENFSKFVDTTTTITVIIMKERIQRD